MLLVFIQGFSTSAALIVAIGAQNAFVLRQGLKREHVGAVVLVCALSDALLITLGVAGLGRLVQGSPLLLAAARWGGALFLLTYAALAARRAFASVQASIHASPPLSLAAALTTCLGLTYLNPHCWLDTVVLIGALAAQQPPGLRWLFGSGAAAASLVWFAALGHGARLLAPLFARPAAWRVLDAGIALVMLSVAVSLIAGTVGDTAAVSAASLAQRRT